MDFREFCSEFSSGSRPKTTGKSPPNPPKNLPEAFPEYPEVANKPASLGGFGVSGMLGILQQTIVLFLGCANGGGTLLPTDIISVIMLYFMHRFRTDVCNLCTMACVCAHTGTVGSTMDMFSSVWVE